MADENQQIQEHPQTGLRFEDIVPWEQGSGDTGLSARLKLKRNFDKIKSWTDSYFSYLRQYFLSKTDDDTAAGHITFMRGLTAFGSDDEELLPAIEVKGNATFTDNLSTPDFQSGFPEGTGWALQKKKYTNAAGETEYKYVLECDGANIRGTLRVYEFIISQLLGENDNRIFTAMMEVHHYDPETGKVWMKTNNGKLYMPFRVNDCIVVQQYQPGNDIVSGGDGYVTKQYELVITEVGTGGATDENGERLDWVKFSNFTTTMDGGTAETLIAKNDTFCRLDNLTDPERKGIIQMVAVGTNAPYMDIIYGLKTDPDDALKGRIGNLEGIQHHLFGWLDGFGIYTSNAYLVGDLRLRRTGESIDTSLEILRDRLAFKMAETVYEMTGEDNYLANAEFTELDENGNYMDWTVSANNGIRFFTAGGEAVVSSVGTLGNVQSCARTELVEGKQVMHIVNASLTQSKNVIQQPQKHKIFDTGDGTSYVDTYTQVWDKLYLSLRIRVLQDGTLTIGFPRSNMTEDDAIKSKVQILESSTEWQTLKWDGVWDGQSDFYLQFTGECYISLLALTSQPLDDFKAEYSTQILQTTRNITYYASRITQNTTNIASLVVEAQQISSTVSQIRDDVDDLENDVNTHTAQIGSLQVSYDNISSTVNTLSGNVDNISRSVTQLTQTSSLIQQNVAALKTNKIAFTDESEWEKISGNMIRYTSTIGVTKYTLFYLKNIYRLYVDFYDSGGNVTTKSADGQGEDTPVSISVPVSAVSAKPKIYYSRRALETSEIAGCEFMYTEDNVITQSNLSLYVEDNISWLSGDANNIKFIFDKTFKIYSRDSSNVQHEVASLTPDGDMWIKGEYKGGNVTGAMNIGTPNAQRKFTITPSDSSGRATISGYDGNTEVIKLGWNYSGQIHPVLQMINGGTILLYDSSKEGSISPGNISVSNGYGSFYVNLQNNSNLIQISAINGLRFPTETEAENIHQNGNVYVVFKDGDGYLRYYG